MIEVAYIPGLCPIDPGHGRILDIANNRWYCPHQDHHTATRRGGPQAAPGVMTDAEAFPAYDR